MILALGLHPAHGDTEILVAFQCRRMQAGDVLRVEQDVDLGIKRRVGEVGEGDRAVQAAVLIDHEQGAIRGGREFFAYLDHWVCRLDGYGVVRHHLRYFDVPENTLLVALADVQSPALELPGKIGMAEMVTGHKSRNDGGDHDRYGQRIVAG